MLDEKFINLKKNENNSYLFTNVAFAFFPISFVLGSLIVNLNLVLICCLGFYHLKFKIINTKLDITFKIIFIFFLAIFFSTSLSFFKAIYFNGFESIFLIASCDSTNCAYPLEKLIKSILFFRYFLFLLVIYYLSYNNIINFKYFFISAAIVTLIVAVDVIFQYTFGYNFFGFKSYIHHNTSFFTDELIAGGYIQNFSFFSLFYLTYSIKNYNKFLNVALTTTTVCVLGAAILFSGNRMPVVLFLLGLLLVYIFNEKLRNKILLSFFSLIIVLGIIISFDTHFNSSFKSFKQNVTGTVSDLLIRLKTDEKTIIQDEQKEFLTETFELAGHRKIISTAIETWKLHKIFGNGIKSFKVDCQKIIIQQKRGICSNHPHNYFMEILTDLGVVGFINVLIMACLFVFFLFRNYKHFNKNRFGTFFLLAAVISLFLEVFPFKSTGSIFTTNDMTYIILISGIILCHKKLIDGQNLS